MNDDFLREFRAAEAHMGGTLGVAAHRLDRSQPVRYREAESAPAASTIKVFLLLALLEKVAAGEASLGSEVRLRAQDQVTGSGVLKALQPERAHSLRDLAMLMIIVSDNTATNLLVDAVGVAAVEDLCDRHGWRGTRLTGKLQTGEDRPPSTTTSADLADAFTRLWRSELLPEAETAFAKNVFESQQKTESIGRFIGFDPYSTETGGSDVVIASKGGAIRGVRNEAGVLRAGGRDAAGRAYVFAITTKDCPDERFHVDNLGERCIARVSRLLFEHYVGTPDTAPADSVAS